MPLENFTGYLDSTCLDQWDPGSAQHAPSTERLLGSAWSCVPGGRLCASAQAVAPEPLIVLLGKGPSLMIPTQHPPFQLRLPGNDTETTGSTIET